jgi:hypothetical protein
VIGRQNGGRSLTAEESCEPLDEHALLDGLRPVERSKPLAELRKRRIGASVILASMPP